jgi:hypothetical protein
MSEEVIKDDDFNPCPMGCGEDTEDPYGGPCSNCWEELN